MQSQSASTNDKRSEDNQKQRAALKAPRHLPDNAQGLTGRPHLKATLTQVCDQQNQSLIQPDSSPGACGRDESGWCSDVTSTHGAWRHAGVPFWLAGSPRDPFRLNPINGEYIRNIRRNIF